MIRTTRGLATRVIGGFLLVLFFGTGCTVRVADLTLVSTKNIDLSNAHLDARRGVRVTGSDCVFWILGLIPLGVPNLETAIDDALVKGGGNVMVDQVTSQAPTTWLPSRSSASERRALCCGRPRAENSHAVGSCRPVP